MELIEKFMTMDVKELYGLFAITVFTLIMIAIMKFLRSY